MRVAQISLLYVILNGQAVKAGSIQKAISDIAYPLTGNTKTL